MTRARSIQGLALIASVLLNSLPASAGEKSYKAPAPPEPEKWELRLSLPGWIAGVKGETGFNNLVSHESLSFADIVPHLDMAFALRAELRKGRFGIYGEYSYESLSDGIGSSNRLVKKLSGREDEHSGDLGLSWRILNCERGYLEVIAGVKYTNLYEEVTLQGNDERIEEVSTRLARAGTVTRAVLARELRELSGRDNEIPGPQLGADTPEETARAVNRIRGNTTQRQQRIERRLKKDLNRTFSRVDDWFDPYIGLRGQYNFNAKYYALGRADIGGFSVGSDLSWQAKAGFGVNLSPTVFFEFTYRALGMNYDQDGLVYDMITYGPELTLGKIF